jgi:hypothetical protein
VKERVAQHRYTGEPEWRRYWRVRKRIRRNKGEREEAVWCAVIQHQSYGPAEIESDYVRLGDPKVVEQARKTVRLTRCMEITGRVR